MLEQELDERLARAFQLLTQEELPLQIRANIAYNLFVCKEVEENYDLNCLIRSKLSARRIDVPETHHTGLQMFRRLIVIICDGEEQAAALSK